MPYTFSFVYIVNVLYTLNLYRDKNAIHVQSCKMIISSASEDAVERHLSKVMQIHSVHRKKRASNTIEAGTSIYIAPDHDNNQRTRKRKLQATFSETGTFKRLTANNRTAVVVIDNKETRVPVMRIKPKRLEFICTYNYEQFT